MGKVKTVPKSKVEDALKKPEVALKRPAEAAVEDVRARLKSAILAITKEKPAAKPASKAEKLKRKADWKKLIKDIFGNQDDETLGHLLALAQHDAATLHSAMGTIYYWQIKDPEIRRQIVGLVEATDQKIGDEMKNPMPEIPLSEERKLIMGADIAALPEPLRALSQGYPSFFKAMDDKEKVFPAVKADLRGLEKQLSPAFFSEVLLVIGETDGDVELFMHSHGATLWRQVVANPKFFQDFMIGSQFTLILKQLKLTRVIREMLVAAVQARPENGQWIKDKIERDAEGDHTDEDPPYVLAEALTEGDPPKNPSKVKKALKEFLEAMAAPKR